MPIVSKESRPDDVLVQVRSIILGHSQNNLHQQSWIMDSQET